MDLSLCEIELLIFQELRMTDREDAGSDRHKSEAQLACHQLLATKTLYGPSVLDLLFYLTIVANRPRFSCYSLARTVRLYSSAGSKQLN
jgi:hypothetical protein